MILFNAHTPASCKLAFYCRASFRGGNPPTQVLFMPPLPPLHLLPSISSHNNIYFKIPDLRTLTLTGLLIQLKNTVFKELFILLDSGTNTAGVPEHVLKEPVSFIRLAQEKWEGKLHQAINKLCTDYNVVLSRQVW